MQLIGMLDSPYVRRVAVAMLSAGVAFEHKPISLFRHIDAFSRAESDAEGAVADRRGRSGARRIQRHSRISGDALFRRSRALRPQGARRVPRARRGADASMEKAVQVHYERALRGRASAAKAGASGLWANCAPALSALEAEAPDGWFEASLGHADIAAACAWGFTQGMVGDVGRDRGLSRLAAFAARAEALPAFRAAPAVDGVTAEAAR